MSNKGIRKLHELDNTVSYEELQAELEDLQGGWRNQKELAEERRFVISKLCGELDSKDAEIALLKDALRKIAEQALKGEPHD